MAKYIMAMDQGTTSSRCILFNKAGEICSIAQKEFKQYYPHPGWVEHNPMEIWSSQLSVAIEAMANIGVEAKDIAGIGITNQRETTIVWNRETGEPIYNAIVWQCRRTSEKIDELVKEGYSDLIKSKTGLVPDAYFSGSKIGWILDNVEGAREEAKAGKLCFGTVDTWLIYNLTKGKVFVTDYTNASRTMLYDINNLCWDKELLSLFDIPECMLPEVKPSSCVYGHTESGILGAGIPIAGAAGDQQAALFGQCCFNKGEAKNTYGTGCFLLMNTGKEAIYSKNGLITTIAASTDENVEYAIEGSVFVAGAAIQWLRDSMEMIKDSAQSEEFALNADDTEGVYVVPAFTGMGAPYWSQYARGTIVGITRGCEKKHFIRATLESIAYQAADVLKSMEDDLGSPFTELKVDGGASANNFLMQFQADMIGKIVKRPRCIETTALGAAYLAGLSVGYWDSKEDIKNNWEIECEFSKKISDEERARKLKGWKKAVKCALFWAEE